VIPFEFRHELWCQKTWLSCGIICMILCLAVLIQYRSVKDRHTTTAYTALSIASCGKNCDIPIRFRMPICQRNENGKISAESQHNFHFLPHFNSKTTGPIFTIFSHDVEQLFELLTRVSARWWCISFQNTSNFDVCKNPQKLIGYQNVTIAMSVGLVWNFRHFFVIPIHASTKVEMLVKIGSVVVEIGRFLPYRFKSTNFSDLNLWRYWTKVRYICTRCRGIICATKLLIHIAIFNSVLKCQGAEWRSFHQFCRKLVAMATSLEELKKLARIDNIHTDSFHLLKKLRKPVQ